MKFAAEFQFAQIVRATEQPTRADLKLTQEPYVIFVKEANVGDVVADHGDALDAEAERPTAPNFRVVADLLEDLWMDHPATGNLQPFLSHLAGQCARKINLEARLGV